MHDINCNTVNTPCPISPTYRMLSHHRTGVCSAPHVRQSMVRRPAPNQRATWISTVFLSLCLDTQTAALYKSFTTFRPEYRSVLANQCCAVLFYIHLRNDSSVFLTITILEDVNKWTERSARGPFEPAKCFHPTEWRQHLTVYWGHNWLIPLCDNGFVLGLAWLALSTHHPNALFVCRVLSTQTLASRIRAEDSLASVSFLTMTKAER